MIYRFTMVDFPGSEFELETSIWSSKITLRKDDIEIEQSREKGKPFIIPRENQDIVKAFPKTTYPELIPAFEINGTKYEILEKLEWYKYLIGGLPLILIFIGGGVGGAIGALGALLNFNIFRQDGVEINKYLKVIGISLASVFLYIVLVSLISDLIN